MHIKCAYIYAYAHYAARRRRPAGRGARADRDHRKNGARPRRARGLDRPRIRPTAGGARGHDARPRRPATPPHQAEPPSAPVIVLADTSAWIALWRQGNAPLAALLERNQVGLHPFVLGEIALGR